MLKRILLAAVVLSCCSANGFAQQVFVSFEQGADVSATSTADVSELTGSAFIYSAQNLGIQAFDLTFSTTDVDVIQFTGGEIFNSEISLNGEDVFGVRWNDPQTETINTALGNLLAIAVSGNGDTTVQGINPQLASFDRGFDVEAINPEDGNGIGSFLLARFDYDIVGEGTAEITLGVGENEFLELGNLDVTFLPTLGNGTLTVTNTPPAVVPEPSAAGILALGLVGFVARRRR